MGPSTLRKGLGVSGADLAVFGIGQWGSRRAHRQRTRGSVPAVDVLEDRLTLARKRSVRTRLSRRGQVPQNAPRAPHTAVGSMRSTIQASGAIRLGFHAGFEP
jgi:hypothetical protein